MTAAGATDLLSTVAALVVAAPEAGAPDAAAGAAPMLVHYLPILSTLISAAFLIALLSRASKRNWAPHLVWWAVGVFFYGLGTAIESTITLMGNSVVLFKSWYWAGAILGGYPLGTGSLYLLASRRFANTLTAITMVIVVVASVAILLSPVDAEALAREMHRPKGEYLQWQWIRLLTPIINLYAAFWLVGGAFWSSAKWFRHTMRRDRALGTALIGVGGLLPGIGGSMAKAGIPEGLYVGEFVGIILIWIGYWMCLRPAPPAAAPPQQTHDDDPAA